VLPLQHGPGVVVLPEIGSHIGQDVHLLELWFLIEMSTYSSHSEISAALVCLTRMHAESNEYMSIVVNHQEANFMDKRQTWGRLFGLFIQKGREKKGRSVEEVALLAEMDPCAWLAVEAGRVPETAAQLRSIAVALQLTDSQLGIIFSLCRDAWGV
jgi:hypothetical protein